MEKKYQVFVSATYEDLIEERKKVIEILLMADCIPASMESFVAKDNEQFNVIKKVIDLCDYYILIIGNEYGSINESTGLSFTEMEYNYAISKDIPVLVFALNYQIQLQNNKNFDVIKQAKLQQFKERAMKNRLASICNDITDLIANFSISIMQIKQEKPRPGWQRYNSIEYHQEDLLQQIVDLQNQNRILESKLQEYEYNNENKENSTLIDILAFNKEPFTVEMYCPKSSCDIFYYYETCWEDLFKVIGSCLIDDVKKEHIHSYFSSYLTNTNKELIDKLKLKNNLIDLSLCATEKTLNTILIQFSALELIDVCKHGGDFYDSHDTWELTEKGRNCIFKLCSIKKQ